MKLWRHFRSLDPLAFWSLLRLGLGNPTYILPTLRATRQCLAVCDQYFGRQHHRNTPANAFRHALWNYYIARACYRGKTNREAPLCWAQKITDWHEDFSRNSPLARQMDLHNNRIGRAFFAQNPDMVPSIIIGLLENKISASKKISTVEELDKIAPMDFVHIIDPFTK